MYNRSIIKPLEKNKLIEALKSAKGWLAFDTETTGLHLKADKPFLLTITTGENSYALNLLEWDPTDIQEIFNSMEHFEYVMGHNVKYDLHMLENYGVNYKYDNLTDTMVIARLALDTDATMSLALKQLSKKYLSVESVEDEKTIKTALTAIKRANTANLKVLLKEAGKTKKWFDATLKNVTFDTSDLGDFEKVYLKYLKEHPEPTYLDVYDQYKKEMLSYAMNDTELTLELAKKMYPVLLTRQQKDIFDTENAAIMPLYRMERVGLKIDREYLKDRKQAMREYIHSKRERLTELAGEYITVGQHKKIKEVFENKFGVVMSSTDDKHLKGVDNDKAKEFASIISELRTLEKWYSAYIIRLLEASRYDGRAYTQIKQATAVTGRVSSDFQQFPKYAIKDDQGKELYHPRRMVITTGESYETIYYLDYSQIELRVQADYTYQISGGDLNMCRAYMPHECIDQQGKAFDPKEDRDEIFSKKWFLKGDGSFWKPVDLHSATTAQAFPDLNPESAEFKKERAKGKATNFAKNYGATTKALMEQFGFDEDIAKKLNDGYYKAFPKILDYQNLVRSTFNRKGFVKNRYGRRYYMGNKRFVYKLYNYIVQGTAADMLKTKIIEVDKFLLPYKSRFQMNIHDELSFEIYKGEEFLIPHLKEIMEQVDWMIIPVVADIEVTRTNWAEKEDV